ncbi:hypothetical protein ABW20_dc0108561 [Dactylellina cionopaga]|nr:hypothetical protein ABW20_dc0108561 [Dactylellina cionopaga]
MASSSFFRRPRVPEIPCPLCAYTADDASIIQLHFEAVHDVPRPPPKPAKPEALRPKFNKISLAPAEEDAYDPFKYQIPNNDSREIVGAPQYRSSKAENDSAVPRRSRVVAAAAAAPEQPSETEYLTCEWKDCGEPVSLMDLEGHLAMHEEMLDNMDDDDDDEDDDYANQNPHSSDPIIGQRERKGDALMEAASKRRYITKKDGPSNRMPKKLGQMERRLESEAQSQDGELIMKPDDEDDVVKVRKFGEDSESSPQSDDDDAVSVSKDYDIISKDEITEDDDEKSSGDVRKEKEKEKENSHSSRHHHHHHHSGKKLQKQGYGGYELTGSQRSSKRHSTSSPSSSSSSSHKPRFKKSELGPYANEKRMPDWLKDALKAGGKEIITKYIGTDGHVHVRKTYANETSGLIPVIRRLVTLDPNVSKAYLCHPCVRHVFKEHSGANGFCGYRNIQMMASYCRKVLVPGCEKLFEERIPTVIQIQKWIENAWDMGINAHAREETGGILYTRKYIGSSEVESMFTSFGTATIPRQFSEPNQQISALKHVWDYFSAGWDVDPDKVVQTDKPPIYFQHHGHSMTIVGIEQYRDGTFCFICFDPMFSPSQNIRKLVGEKRLRPNIAHGKLLKAFRRGGSYLKRYKIFEMVEYVSPYPSTLVILVKTVN